MGEDDRTGKVLHAIQKNIEVVLQFLIMGFAIFGAAMAGLEASRQMAYGANVPALRSTADIRTAAFSLLAAYLGIVVAIMLVMPFVNQRFSFVPEGPKWGFPVITIGVTSVLATYIYLKLWVMGSVDNIEESAIFLLKGMHTMEEVRSNPTLGKVNLFAMHREGQLDGFSFSFWMGLPALQRILDSDEATYRIPLIMRGVPKTWAYKTASGAEKVDILVKSPVIYLVLGKARNPYFEVEFNHMEMTEDADLSNERGCGIEDQFTAKCTFLGKDKPELEAQNLLKISTDGDATRLHHVAFVFSETYRYNAATRKKELYTEIRLYVNGQSADVNYFQGQLRQAATYAAMLPVMAFRPPYFTEEAKYASLLAGSRFADVRFFSYALSAPRVSGIHTSGYGVLPG